MKKAVLLILSFCLMLSIAGCAKEDEGVITMGFVPMRDGDKLIDSVEPLTDMLAEELGVPVKGFTATNYIGVVEGLGSDQVDFGFIPPFAYVLANKENDAEVILTAINDKGEANYKSAFLVREDSDIKDFEDIRGKRVAFVDPSSTSGYIFPAAHLKMLGIDLDKDIQTMDSGGHDKSLQLLLNGDVDVIATFSTVVDRYKDEFPDAKEKTRVLGYTEDIPNISVTVNGEMDKAMSDKIKAALLKIVDTEEGSEMLKDLFNMHGFKEATDADYDIIRKTAETLDIDLEKMD